MEHPIHTKFNIQDYILTINVITQNDLDCCLSFKYVDKNKKLWNFEADRTNIAEVTPEWILAEFVF